LVDQFQTPLFTALRKHAETNQIQFHILGHKKGNGMDPDFREFIGKNALSIDLINIGPLDDLHLINPTYYGVSGDLKKIIKISNSWNISYYLGR
jgi:arginine/lysine/ornithine decarboxylase